MKIGNYTLTPVEKVIVEHYGFGPSEIRVAQRWQNATGYSDQMKADGHSVSVNAKPCGTCGHTVRLRRGHCVVCQPQSLAHQLRHERAGWVYLAVSRRTQQVKVGLTSDPYDRERSLNDGAGYSQACDWSIVRKLQAPAPAGALEWELQALVAQGKSPSAIAYRLSGDAPVSREAFNVDLDEALKRWDEGVAMWNKALKKATANA